MDRTLDARGWTCPLPVLRASKILAEMAPGDRLTITATDAGSVADMVGWAKADARVALESQDERSEGGATLYVHVVRRR